MGFIKCVVVFRLCFVCFYTVISESLKLGNVSLLCTCRFVKSFGHFIFSRIVFVLFTCFVLLFPILSNMDF